MLLRINQNKLHDTIMKVIINSIFVQKHIHIYDSINHKMMKLLKKTFEVKINIKSENYYEVACKCLQFNSTNKDEIKHKLMTNVAIFKHVRDNLCNYHN